MAAKAQRPKKPKGSKLYKGGFLENCLWLYDKLKIERRPGQRTLLASMAEEMERHYARRQRIELDAAMGIETGAELKGCGYQIGQAPVGTGKTYVLLILAFVSWWLYRKRTVISTQTKILQNQLITKDIPAFKKLLADVGLPPGSFDDWNCHTVKGRANFICPNQLKKFRQWTSGGRDLIIHSLRENRTLVFSTAKLDVIAGAGSKRISLDIDRAAELSDEGEGDLLPFINASEENCDSEFCAFARHSEERPCPYYASCFQKSALIISNHSVVTSKLQALKRAELEKEPESEVTDSDEIANEIVNEIESELSESKDEKASGKKAALLSANNYFFDEAHHLMGYFTAEESEFRLETAEVYKTLTAPLFPGAAYKKAVKELFPRKSLIFKNWEKMLELLQEVTEGKCWKIEEAASLCETLKSDSEFLSKELSALPEEVVRDALPANKRLYDKFAETGALLERIKENVKEQIKKKEIAEPPSYITVDSEGLAILKYSEENSLSSDIEKYIPEAEYSGFISGTLLIDSLPSVFTAEAGLPENTPVVEVPSPFEHRHVQLWVPKANEELKLPGCGPSEKQMSEDRITNLNNFCRKYVPGYVKHNNGGVLILCTSIERMKSVAATLRPLLDPMPGRELFVQGEMPRVKLVGNYLNSQSPVLVASNSFREGFDAVREKLTWVIMDKLPYDNNGASEKRRLELLEKTGKIRSESEHRMNLMLFNLIQAMGRLERSTEDWGTLTVLDPRFYWMTKEGKQNPFLAISSDFLEKSEAAFESGEYRYMWFRKDKWKDLKDGSYFKGRSFKEADGLIPFDWLNKDKFIDRFITEEEWTRRSRKLYKEAQEF
ncbi:MAG: ATP-dependent DNA helicase [Synergistaceae bacterium]|nr:ATP-dependent DNA helicase [Synergistaceae bacterium]